MIRRFKFLPAMFLTLFAFTPAWSEEPAKEPADIDLNLALAYQYVDVRENSDTYRSQGNPSSGFQLETLHLLVLPAHNKFADLFEFNASGTSEAKNVELRLRKTRIFLADLKWGQLNDFAKLASALTAPRARESERDFKEINLSLSPMGRYRGNFGFRQDGTNGTRDTSVDESGNIYPLESQFDWKRTQMSAGFGATAGQNTNLHVDARHSDFSSNERLFLLPGDGSQGNPNTLAQLLTFHSTRPVDGTQNEYSASMDGTYLGGRILIHAEYRHLGEDASASGDENSTQTTPGGAVQESLSDIVSNADTKTDEFWVETVQRWNRASLQITLAHTADSYRGEANKNETVILSGFPSIVSEQSIRETEVSTTRGLINFRVGPFRFWKFELGVGGFDRSIRHDWQDPDRILQEKINQRDVTYHGGVGYDHGAVSGSLKGDVGSVNRAYTAISPTTHNTLKGRLQIRPKDKDGNEKGWYVAGEANARRSEGTGISDPEMRPYRTDTKSISVQGGYDKGGVFGADASLAWTDVSTQAPSPAGTPLIDPQLLEYWDQNMSSYANLRFRLLHKKDKKFIPGSDRVQFHLTGQRLDVNGTYPFLLERVEGGVSFKLPKGTRLNFNASHQRYKDENLPSMDYDTWVVRGGVGLDFSRRKK